MHAARRTDWALCGLLGFGTLGHLAGTMTLMEIGSPVFVWSLSGVLACGLLTAVNALRVTRGAQDRALAKVALVGNLGWFGVALLFGRSIGNMSDPRALLHAAAALGEAYFRAGAFRSEGL
jgi:hypothetical protein